MVKDEGLKMKDEGWIMKDEDWMMKDEVFKLLRGFNDEQTNELTDGQRDIFS